MLRLVALLYLIAAFLRTLLVLVRRIASDDLDEGVNYLSLKSESNGTTSSLNFSIPSSLQAIL